MYAITSISPTHTNANIQGVAVQSWVDLGMKVYSFNNKAECNILRPLYPNVIFIETFRTMEAVYQKPLVSINAVLDWAKAQEENNFCLINSDVQLITDKETIERIEVKMFDGIVLDNRIDYDTQPDNSREKYTMGIDVFFIHKRWMPVFPQSMHCFGMTFWDYFIPYVALKHGIEVSFVEQKIAFHKAHKAQYSQDNWKKSGRFFLWQEELYNFNPTNQIGNMSQFVYNYIYTNSKRILI